MRAKSVLWSAVGDLSRVVLKDKRHAQRVVKIARRAIATPRVSFPRMMDDEGELEGTYRFFSNPKVSADKVLSAHHAATAERVRTATTVTVVAHDTSDLCFGGGSERKGVGSVSNDGKGLSLHAALAMSMNGVPLGLLDVTTHTRLKKLNSEKTSAKRLPSEKESARWGNAVESAMKRVGPHTHAVVHVMDREADNYLLLDQLLQHGRSFVIRLCHNRRLADGDHDDLQGAVEEVRAVVERAAPLSSRTDRNRRLSAKKRHPARSARVATLSIGATTVTLRSSKLSQPYVAQVKRTVNIVRVWEAAPPEGEQAIEWRLITDLPISTAAELEAIVEYYRLRWTIEEFFKSLKSGCAIEERQLESRHALDNAIAVLAPIACQLLLLRTVGRTHPDSPATDVLSKRHLALLTVMAKRNRLPDKPTARDALHAVAGLGGFLKRNGEPGWQTLSQGFERLLILEAGWKAAKHITTSDQ